ncbi:MAG: ATP-binding protein [Promethearchaeota archaeon]
MDEQKKKKYTQAARIIVKSGILPFPVTDTLLEIMDLLYTEEEISFINKAFRRKPSQTMEQLIKSSKMSEEDILKNTNSLAAKGALFNQPSSSGIMIYRLLPLIMVGIFEYTFMKKVEHTEMEKRIAKLFEKLFDEVNEAIQDKYDMMLPMFKQIPPVDRTVPIFKTSEGKEITVEINKEVDVPQEQVLASQKVEEIIEKFDDIAVAHCFCRQHQELLGHICSQDPPEECCFTFGKSAKFVSEQGFGRLISKEEAKVILKKCDDAGLVHKAYHPHGDITKEETSLCNCCKDCCGTFDLWKSGTTPMVNATNYLARTDKNLCTGCGICVEKCPTDAIELGDDGKAERNEDWCIGCGICARFCPENAVSLIEGERIVYVSPPRVKQ